MHCDSNKVVKLDNQDNFRQKRLVSKFSHLNLVNIHMVYVYDFGISAYSHIYGPIYFDCMYLNGTLKCLIIIEPRTFF